MTDIDDRLRRLEQELLDMYLEDIGKVRNDIANIKADIAEFRLIIGSLNDWREAERREAERREAERRASQVRELSGRRMFGEFPGYQKPTNTAE